MLDPSKPDPPDILIFKSGYPDPKINLTGVGIDRCASAYADSSFSSSCIDSILFCITCSASGVDVVSINATKCLSVDAGALLSIDADIWC
ncbi:hypothetical protein F2Q68_00016209 [Brassica cretica]|uniref:Uncharacterized protein n=1 Tax=Brassica cretica TaxID=69181 RepID=A0A8S9HGT3_BRACR|nr:hypothetical protein F2Q68_00016209 [Brassica cretica]